VSGVLAEPLNKLIFEMNENKKAPYNCYRYLHFYTYYLFFYNISRIRLKMLAVSLLIRQLYLVGVWIVGSNPSTSPTGPDGEIATINPKFCQTVTSSP